jgi:hypothetical protein
MGFLEGRQERLKEKQDMKDGGVYQSINQLIN